MKSWHDEDLVMYRYGEHPDADALRRALASDPELAKRLAEIVRTLELAASVPVVEPPAGYEESVWRRVRPELHRQEVAPGASRGTATARPASDLFARLLDGATPRLGMGSTWRFAALAATLVAAIAGAYLAGKASVRIEPARAADGALPPAAFSAEERERLLLASLTGHLGSSSLLLTDLANAPAENTVGEERAWAEGLLASNRLYRQAAQRAGQRRIVMLLDELEPVLLELAHAPEGATVNDLQQQLEERDLLFRVRVLATRLETGSAEKTRPARAL